MAINTITSGTLPIEQNKTPFNGRNLLNKVITRFNDWRDQGRLSSPSMSQDNITPGNAGELSLLALAKRDNGISDGPCINNRNISDASLSLSPSISTKNTYPEGALDRITERAHRLSPLQRALLTSSFFILLSSLLSSCSGSSTGIAPTATPEPTATPIPDVATAVAELVKGTQQAVKETATVQAVLDSLPKWQPNDGACLIGPFEIEPGSLPKVILEKIAAQGIDPAECPKTIAVNIKNGEYPIRTFCLGDIWANEIPLDGGGWGAGYTVYLGPDPFITPVPGDVPNTSCVYP